MSQQEAQTGNNPTAGNARAKRVRVSAAILGTLLMILLLLGGSVGIVSLWPESALGMVFRKVLPIPVAVVNGVVIRYQDLDESRRALRHYYESQADSLAEGGFRVDFDTPDGEKRLLVREKDILNKLIEDRSIQLLAERRYISFSDDDAEKGINETIEQGGGSRDVFEEHLENLYGWNISDFRDRVVLPSLYRSALEADFNKTRDVSSANDSIKKASDALSREESFEEVARQYSDGDSKERGGDLGWARLDTLVPELAEAARKQNIGVLGPIIESEIGYHIVFVVDRKLEGDQEFARLKQIFARKPSFPAWLSEEKRKMSVHILPRRYIWNSETAVVEFRDSALRDFESEALKKTDGDPSLIF